MAEEKWWESLTSKTKIKSAEVFDFVKKDINELTTIMAEEAKTMALKVKTEATNIAEAVKESLQLDQQGSPGGTIKKLLKDLWDPMTIDDQLSPLIIKDSKAVPVTDLQYKHLLLVSDPSTFKMPIPAEEEQRFKEWSFKKGSKLEDVGYLGKRMSTCPPLEEKYRNLVPSEVSHSDFWSRYLYRSESLDSVETGKIEPPLQYNKSLAEFDRWEDNYCMP